MCLCVCVYFAVVACVWPAQLTTDRIVVWLVAEFLGALISFPVWDLSPSPDLSGIWMLLATRVMSWRVWERNSLRRVTTIRKQTPGSEADLSEGGLLVSTMDIAIYSPHLTVRPCPAWKDRKGILGNRTTRRCDTSKEREFTTPLICPNSLGFWPSALL